MSNSYLLIGSKSADMHYKVTEKFKKILARSWDIVNFPDTARQRFSCKLKKFVPFKSEADFVLTILRKEFSKSKLKFNWDMEINNPDF